MRYPTLSYAALKAAADNRAGEPCPGTAALDALNTKLNQKVEPEGELMELLDEVTVASVLSV